MKTRIKHEDLQLIGPIRWVHRFAMLVSYPFRHYCLVLTIALLFVAVPYFQGVPFHNFSTWYSYRITMTKNMLKRFVYKIKGVDTAVDAYNDWQDSEWQYTLSKINEQNCVDRKKGLFDYIVNNKIEE